MLKSLFFTFQYYCDFCDCLFMLFLLAFLKTKLYLVVVRRNCCCSTHYFYAPNFEEVEGAYWFGSVRAVSQSVSQSVSLSVMREHSVRNR